MFKWKAIIIKEDENGNQNVDVVGLYDTAEEAIKKSNDLEYMIVDFDEECLTLERKNNEGFLDIIEIKKCLVY